MHTESEAPQAGGLRRLAGALCATLVCGAFVLGTNRGLELPDTPHGMLDLQFAMSVDEAKSVLRRWDDACGPAQSGVGCIGWSDAQKAAEAHVAAARQHTVRLTIYLDFAFLLAYSIFLWRLCRWLAGALDWPRAVRGMAMVAAPLAGVFDASENMAHLMFLKVGADGLGTVLFNWGHYSASVKWLLILLIVIFIVVAALRALMRRLCA